MCSILLWVLLFKHHRTCLPEVRKSLGGPQSVKLVDRLPSPARLWASVPKKSSPISSLRTWETPLGPTTAWATAPWRAVVTRFGLRCCMVVGSCGTGCFWGTWHRCERTLDSVIALYPLHLVLLILILILILIGPQEASKTHQVHHVVHHFDQQDEWHVKFFSFSDVFHCPL